MRILVTGSSGYIGQNVVLELLEKGYQVIGLDLKDKPDHKIEYKNYIGDYGDERIVNSIFEGWKIDAVCHLAAFASVPDSVEYPFRYYDNNVSKLISFLYKMINFSTTKIVFSSSAAVYGNTIFQPIVESAARIPCNPYGRTKLIDEMILTDFAKAYGLDSISLRYFCAAGADDQLRAGENLDTVTRLIPTLINRAYDGKEFCLYGTNYNTEDGTCVRDFVHVSDIATAHILALEKLKEYEEQPLAEFYNLGNSVGYSVKEIISGVQDITGKKINVKYCEQRVGDPAVLIASNSKAIKHLKWEPVGSLYQMIKSTWDWKLKCESMRQS